MCKLSINNMLYRINIFQCLKVGDMLLDTVNVCVVRVRNYTTASFFSFIFNTSGFENDPIFLAISKPFLANLGLKTGLMTHREGFCTGTAKSVSRYDIYLE